MASLTLKNIPDVLHRQLKERAMRNRRSLNSEVLHCLEVMVAAEPVDPEAHIVRIEALRRKTARLPLTPERLAVWREEGRS